MTKCYYAESGIRIVEPSYLDSDGLGILTLVNGEEADGHRFPTKAEKRIDPFR